MELELRDAAEAPKELNQTDLTAHRGKAEPGSGMGGARTSSTKTRRKCQDLGGGWVTLINPRVNGGIRI